MYQHEYVTNAYEQKLAYDEELRKYMLGVYNNMTLALAISGLTSLGISMNTALMAAIWSTPLAWVVVFLPLVMSFGFMFLIEKINTRQAQLFLYSFAVAMGVSLSSIFKVYTSASITNVFFISAATFGAASLYGYTTKKDLTSFGSFLIMGALGLVIAGVVNVFLQSTMLTFVISALGVLIFTGLTAYDTQQLKSVYDYTVGEEREKLGVIGALQLYLDFINIFVSLLQLIGEKKE
jgi:FtsH-binding integral membrane protein